MAVAPDLLAHDWLGACRRAADGLRDVLERHPTSAERCVETGDRGEGGDLTLVIDAAGRGRRLRRARAPARARAPLHRRLGGARLVDFGDGRASPSSSSTRSTARSTPSAACPTTRSRSRWRTAPTMADVAFGYVYDLGPGEEWHAVRGEGALLDGVRARPRRPSGARATGASRSSPIESADPRWLAAVVGRPVRRHAAACARSGRSRSRCARSPPTRVDGMATLWKCRAVDAAAAQLIVRESGGVVAFTALRRPARRAAGPRAALPGGRRPHGRGARRARHGARPAP